MVKINNFLLHFAALFIENTRTKQGDGISETLNSKLFWGNMHQNHLLVRKNVLLCVHLQNPTCYAPENISLCAKQKRQDELSGINTKSGLHM